MSVISNHVALAIARLLEQYKRKPVLEGFVESLVLPVQDLENHAYTVETDRAIDTAAGIQLDLLGVIVGVARELGQTDDDYRLAIKAKVVENTSQGEPERVISIFKTLTESSLVFLDDDALGGLGLMGDVDLTDQDYINAVFVRLENAAAAGARVDFLGSFDPVEPFAFSGSLGGNGFGSVTDVNAGGKFGYLYTNRNEYFSFDGDNPFDSGFGTTQDGLVGGVMVGL